MCSWETYVTLLHYMAGEQSKSQTQYGISWNPEYDATNNCTNPQMPLSHQSLLVELVEEM